MDREKFPIATLSVQGPGIDGHKRLEHSRNESAMPNSCDPGYSARLGNTRIVPLIGGKSHESH